MKKTISTIVSLIILFSFTCTCFADNYEIDSFSNSSGSSYSSQQVKVSSSCYYDKVEQYFIYNLSTTADDYIKCTVYNGEITTDSVQIKIGESAKVGVFRDGEEISCSGDVTFNDIGFYTVRNTAKDTKLFTFTIVKSVTGLISSYDVPSIFNLSSITLDGVDQSKRSGNLVSLSQEGHYSIRYFNSNAGISRTLELDIDLTPPVLEIIGVNDGLATGPVNFGKVEEDSSIEMIKDGSVIPTTAPLTERGTYHINYTDKAGNTSSYDFTIRLYLNVNSWVFLITVVAAVLFIIGFMIYCRKNMRTY